MAGAMCSKVADSSQEVCCPIHPAIMSWNKTFHSIAGGRRGRFCWCSVCAVCSVSRGLARSCAVLRRLAPSCRLRRLARWCEMVQMVSTAKQPRYATAMFHSNQPEAFPLSAGVSRPYLPPAPNKATETVIFFFGKMFAPAAAAAAAGAWCN